ncbi:MAG: nucleotidyltransferase family protein [Planctomycetes bacterium]|nr:nucleotidyltransferase family protein [Planctomycetota bacterium]
MNRTVTHDLLLHCLRKKSNASRLEQLTESEWQARSHAVLYLLYHRLKARNLDRLIPADILETIRPEYFECAWRNNSLYSDLSKILKALH